MSTPVVKNLVGGEWIDATTDQYENVYNPSTGEVIAQTPLSGPTDTSKAIAAAHAAAPRWAATPIVDRARLMFRYREVLEGHFDALAQLITREHGKTLAESRAEVRRGIEVVEFACGIPSLFMGRALNNIATSVDCAVDRHPLGVCVGITPYNFPAMVPMWMFPIALVCGNPFILKPSEKVPLAAVRLAELLQEAGCPAGVFNLLHGGRACVDALLSDPGVAAISFVGSSPVARDVYVRGTASGKRVQAAGGAKNFCVIMPDADPDIAVKALAAASFGCGGQRCMATSIAIPVGEIGDPLVQQLADYATSLSVGPTDQGQLVDMGPLIRSEHVKRVAAHLTQATDNGATLAVDGRRQSWDTEFFLGPCIVDHVQPDMPVARQEIFGPVLSVLRANSLEEALETGQQCEFGNGASIFTRDGFAARQFREHFNAGMIGVNVGVPAPMAWFPFTGWNGSFFGDLHVQGLEGIEFYTRQKVTMTRWPQPTDSHHDPVWK